MARKWWRRSSRPAGTNRTGTRLLVGLAAGTVLLTSACANTGRSDGDEGDGGERLVLGVATVNESWDPAMGVDAGDRLLSWQPVFDTLLKNEPDGSITPNAAESFSFNEDNTVLTLRLREGMTFTNGDPVDAAAAQASLEHYRDGAGPGAQRLAGIEVETTGDLTLTITSPAPNPLIAYYLTLSGGALASPAQLDSADVAREPIGSGPYVYDADASASGTNLVFERNDDYWNADAYPYESVELKVLPDETARLNALQSGQINGTALGFANAAQAEEVGLDLVQTEAVWAGLVIADREGEIVPALGDVRVRRAINMVFDRDAIVASLLQGRGSAGAQVFNPETDGYVDELDDRYPYDVEAARALMAEAGYADGFEITLPEITGNPQSAFNPFVVEQLGLLGIRATVEPIQAARALPRYLAGEFPLFLYLLPNGSEQANIDAYLAPDALWNPLGATDPRLTELIEQARLAPAEEAAGIYRQINELVTDEAWFAVWGYPATAWAFDDTTTADNVLGSPTPYLFTFR